MLRLLVLQTETKPRSDGRTACAQKIRRQDAGAPGKDSLRCGLVLRGTSVLALSIRRALELWFALGLVGFEVGAEARYDLVFLAFVEFFLYFFQCEVDYVVVV